MQEKSPRLNFFNDEKNSKQSLKNGNFNSQEIKQKTQISKHCDESDNLLQDNRDNPSSLTPVTNTDNMHFHSSFKADMNFFIKLVIAIVGVITIFVNTIYGFLFPHGNVGCMQDIVFDHTKFLNEFFHSNIAYRNLLLIVASFCIDFSQFYILIIWVFYSKSYRFLISLGLFYLIRSAIQCLFQMRFPEGYLWEYPGFPSVFVSYLKTNDFFFSGHVGLPILQICELYKFKNFFMIYFCMFTLILEFFTMIVLRGHYSIDLVTGIFMAHYCYILTDKYIYIIDDYTKINNNTNNNLNEEFKDGMKVNEYSKIVNINTLKKKY